MVKLTSVLAFGLTVISGLVSAELSADHVPTKISVTSQFPNNPFGLIVNGQRNQVLLDVTSKEDTPYTVFAISGQVFKADDFSQSVRNLTASRYEKLLQPGSTLQIPYNFYSEFAPGDHGLTVYVDLLNEKTVTRIVGYNGTITVTDPENSFFDPQLIVLYIVLIAGAVGVGYVIREAFFADTKKKTKKAKKVIESNEKPTHRDEKGEMVLDQSWIPEQHLNLSKGSPKAKKRATRK